MLQIEIPDTGKQVFAAAFLAEIRENGLHEAVGRSVASVDPSVLRAEIVSCAPSNGLKILQGTGVRDEEVFATPSMFREAPGILTYFRLLLGISQKQFYTKASGLNLFKPMETRNAITPDADANLEHLAISLNEAMYELLLALPEKALRVNVDQLPLLTLGAQADGSWRTKIGTNAATEVFEALKSIVRSAKQDYVETASSITVINSSNREVTLMLAPDPDVVIREDFGTSSVYKAAIEIKGGSDYANIHNRAGEAEKSHQKARQDGAGDCWTVINLHRAEMNKLRQESPSTREWIDLVEVQGRSGETWRRLTDLTRSAMGI